MRKNNGHHKGVYHPDKAETARRVRIVQEYLMQGHLSRDIIDTCTIKFNVKSRTVEKYIQIARQEFVRALDIDVKERLSEHIHMRQLLFAKLKDKDQPNGARAALHIIRDIAKLENLYVNTDADKSPPNGASPLSQVVNVTMNI